MSAIFSDPMFERGATLLAGEKIEGFDSTGAPVAGEQQAGNDMVGQVKAFVDADPVSGDRHSSRLVYCVAARYKGDDVDDASTIAGNMYTFNAAASLTEFSVTGTAAGKTVAADVNAGKAHGVLDEYLTGKLRTNDIVWLVVKGPTKVNSTGAVTAGAMVAQSSTAGVAAAIGATGASTVAIGQAIDAAASNKLRVNLVSNSI